MKSSTKRQHSMTEGGRTKLDEAFAIIASLSGVDKVKFALLVASKVYEIRLFGAWAFSWNRGATRSVDRCRSMAEACVITKGKGWNAARYASRTAECFCEMRSTLNAAERGFTPTLLNDLVKWCLRKALKANPNLDLQSLQKLI